MTWSIVSSPSMATELYHVADNLNKFGFFFDEDTQYYTIQLSHWMTCLVVSSPDVATLNLISAGFFYSV